jgi:hypothetical protein
MKRLLIMAILTGAIVAQPSGPHAESITALPAAALVVGTCRSASSGYLEVNGRTELSDVEMGQYVNAALRAGEVLTLYQTTTRGVFANSECPGAKR